MEKQKNQTTKQTNKKPLKDQSGVCKTSNLIPTAEIKQAKGLDFTWDCTWIFLPPLWLVISEKAALNSRGITLTKL